MAADGFGAGNDKNPDAIGFAPSFHYGRSPAEVLNTSVRTAPDKDYVYVNVYDFGSRSQAHVFQGSIHIATLIEFHIFRLRDYTINIDHHPTKPRFGRINWVEPEASSAGELIYKLIQVGATISEVEMRVDWSKRRGKSKMNLMKTATGYIGIIFKKGQWKIHEKA